MTATKGKGRGKTKGATSFVTISLNALNEVLKPTASVMVSRKFVEALGLSGNKVASNSTTVKNDKEEKDVLVDF